MNLSTVRGILEEAGRRSRQVSVDASSMPSPDPSMLTQQSDDNLKQEMARPLSDEEMLARARAAYRSGDFTSLAAGPEANGPWKRVKAVGRFVVFRRETGGPNELEAMCAGRLDASLEEVASILRSSSEAEHNAAMAGLYAKNFIFGSYERDVPCSENQEQHLAEDDAVMDSIEQLAVKTKSFARTAMLGNNEQWCYFDYFRRKTERDGFTISKRALGPSEVTPGRIVGDNARVDQLHGLNASYLKVTENRQVAIVKAILGAAAHKSD
ncbi:hypothetical protein PHYPSEUDO_001082 [Phytophthora pseudosyringae]|uniref:Uncharacterized protein n=1 Tax=Phytophthora pseudosyringae TaxID=221518 RepID=A0A8T1V3I5_9STRA|nr:hypothetical protein PHYPSEUDO_001082 [Phytophthora pseudosyringae]